jgi:hypothetical protein
MQATTRFHNSVPNTILQQADLVFHDPEAFHPANGMFNPDADGRDPTIRRFLRGREFPTTRFLLGLDNRDTGQDESLEAPILIETTSGGQAITLEVRQAFIVGLPFIGGTQEANLTRLIDHEEVFDRVAFLLATVIFLLLFRIPRAMDGSLSTIMPKRGDVVPSCVCLLVRSVANSPVVRAGSSSCWAKA